MKPLLFSAATLLLAACGVLRPVKDASTNYLLDPLVPERAISGSSPAIAIARPSLPGYLDRQQLVSRAADGRILMNSFHLWAEPLDAGISRVTASNLARLANSLNIQPVESFVTLDYDRLLEIRIARFEPDASGDVVLECTWKLQPVSGRVSDPHVFRTRVPAGGPLPAMQAQTPVVAAMNEALARLAREIARAL
jgi:hypothetical protein